MTVSQKNVDTVTRIHRSHEVIVYLESNLYSLELVRDFDFDFPGPVESTQTLIQTMAFMQAALAACAWTMGHKEAAVRQCMYCSILKYDCDVLASKLTIPLS